MDFFARHSKDPDGDEPTDLSSIHADDELIESLRAAPLFADFDAESADASEYGPDAQATQWWAGEATGHSAPRHSAPEHPVGNAQLADLLHAWRQELASVPLPEPMSTAAAAAIVRAAPVRSRSLRPMLAVAVAIVGLLLGSAAIGARSATPGSILWPVTKLLWSDRANSLEAGQDARNGIDEANAALDAGHPDAAVIALEHVTVVLTKVEVRDGRQTLESDYQQAKASLEGATAARGPAGTTPQNSTSTVSTTPTVVSTTNQPSDPPSSTPSETASPDQTTPQDSATSQPSTPASSDASTVPNTSVPGSTPVTTSQDPSVPTSADQTTVSTAVPTTPAVPQSVLNADPSSPVTSP